MVKVSSTFWGLESNMCLAVPGQILCVDQSSGMRMGRVDFGGVLQEVCLEYTPEAVVGDFVVVHVGFSIAKLDTQRVEETFRLLEQIPRTGVEDL